jgi:nucleoside-diphosphate-sugar epimerase
MRIFLTGATGVVGRRAVPLLVEAGHRVTAVGRTPEKRAALSRAGATPVDLDLFDPQAVGPALAGHDAVVNLATHIPHSGTSMLLPGAWRENDRIRRDASRILVDAAIAQGVPRFIQESFAPMYADAGDAWIDETSPIQPARYNRSTVDAERSAERITRNGGAGIVLRFSALYGPDSPHAHELIGYVRKGRAPIPGSPWAFLSSVTNDDAATAVVAALGLPAGIYNVTDDEPLRRREYFDTLAQTLRVAPPKPPPAWLMALGGSLAKLMARSLRISNRKLRQASGWRPRYPSAREGWKAILEEIQGAGIADRPARARASR